MNVLVQESETILNRLERLSADSIWAHRASGLRGAILREMAKIEVTQDQQPLQLLLTPRLYDPQSCCKRDSRHIALAPSESCTGNSPDILKFV